MLSSGMTSSKTMSPSASFTSLGFVKASSPRNVYSQRMHSKSAGSSPRKSDGDDEEFEILG